MLMLGAVAVHYEGGRASTGIFWHVERLNCGNASFVECRNNEGQAGVGWCRLHHEVGIYAG